MSSLEVVQSPPVVMVTHRRSPSATSGVHSTSSTPPNSLSGNSKMPSSFPVAESSSYSRASRVANRRPLTSTTESYTTDASLGGGSTTTPPVTGAMPLNNPAHSWRLVAYAFSVAPLSLSTVATIAGLAGSICTNEEPVATHTSLPTATTTDGDSSSVRYRSGEGESSSPHAATTPVSAVAASAAPTPKDRRTRCPSAQ